MTNKMIKLNLRLPDDLHTLLVELAKRHDRSLNAEIIQAIKFHLLNAEKNQVSDRMESEKKT